MIKKTKLVHDVYVGANGVVFDNNREVIFCDPRLKNINAESYFENNAEIIPSPGEWIHMLSVWNIHVFGHIHEDMLRLKTFENNSSASVLRNRSHFTSWGELGAEGSLIRHMACFGFDQSRQKPLKIGPPSIGPLYRVEQLHMPDQSSPASAPNAEELMWLKRKWSEGINPSKQPAKHDRVYITRPVGRRGVHNDDQVREYLENHGFYILESDVDFTQQMRLFRDATTIIGPHGGAFVNVLFCENNPTIVEFMPHNRSVNMFKHISSTLGSANHIIKEAPGDSKHCITIDIDELSAFV